MAYKVYQALEAAEWQTKEQIYSRVNDITREDFDIFFRHFEKTNRLFSHLSPETGERIYTLDYGSWQILHDKIQKVKKEEIRLRAQAALKSRMEKPTNIVFHNGMYLDLDAIAAVRAHDAKKNYYSHFADSLDMSDEEVQMMLDERFTGKEENEN